MSYFVEVASGHEAAVQQVADDAGLSCKSFKIGLVMPLLRLWYGCWLNVTVIWTHDNILCNSLVDGLCQFCFCAINCSLAGDGGEDDSMAWMDLSPAEAPTEEHKVAAEFWKLHALAYERSKWGNKSIDPKQFAIASAACKF
eukprot:1707881-Amphidinium_carterae.1